MPSLAAKFIRQKTLAIFQLAVRKLGETLGWNQRIGEYPLGGDEELVHSSTKCMDFFTAGVMQTGTTDFYDLTDDFSISLWVKPESSLVGDSTILYRSEGSSNYPWRIWLTGGALNARFYDASPLMQHDMATTAITIGEWAHICITFDSDLAAPGAFYVNGVSVTGLFVGSSAPLDSTSGQRIIAGKLLGEAAIDHRLDEISLWNKALSSDEVASLYNSGKPTDLTLHSAAANKIAWWRMGDIPADTFATIKDASGVSDLTQSGAAQAIVTDAP